MRVPPGSQLVFDQVLTVTPLGSATVALSDARFNDWLGAANDLNLFVLVERVGGSGAVISISVQESVDEDVAWSWFDAVIVASGVFLSTQNVFLGAVTEGTTSGAVSPGFRRIFVSFGVDDINGGSAHVRIWAVGRGGRRKFNRLVFSERIEGSNPSYTSHDACAWLANADKLSFMATAEEVSGTGPTWTVQMQESPNGRAWADVPGATWGTSAVSNGSINGMSFFDGFLPVSGFIRFRIQLGGTSPAAKIRLWVTGRDIRAG